MNQRLIFDIGLHTGRDAKFYLDKGFSVVGVEANPALCAAVRATLAPAINAGRLVVVERALAERSDERATLHVNPDKDDWSSLNREAAEKGAYTSHPVEVSTITLTDLFDRHGVPYYVKCDIEGHDALFVRQLLVDSRRPAFVSIELGAVSDLACLQLCGYDRFQLVNQNLHPFFSTPPMPPREGEYADAQMDGHMSGLFGRELPPDRWFAFEEVAERYLLWDRLRRMDPRLGVGWLDVHATHAATLGEPQRLASATKIEEPPPTVGPESKGARRIVPLGQNCIVNDVALRWGLGERLVHGPFNLAVFGEGVVTALEERLIAFRHAGAYTLEANRDTGEMIPRLRRYWGSFTHETAPEWLENDMAAVRERYVERADRFLEAVTGDVVFTVSRLWPFDVAGMVRTLRQLAGRPVRLIVFDHFPEKGAIAPHPDVRVVTLPYPRADYHWFEEHQTPEGRLFEEAMADVLREETGGNFAAFSDVEAPAPVKQQPGAE